MINDIVFQFGEFINSPSNSLKFVQSILITLLGAFFSAFIAVRMFNRGLKKDQENAKRIKEIRMNYIKTTFKVLLNHAVTQLEKQIKEYDDFCGSMKNNMLENLALRIYPFRDLQRLANIELIELIELFEFIHFDNKTLTDFTKDLDYINDVVPQIHEDFNHIYRQRNFDIANNAIREKDKVLTCCSKIMKNNFLLDSINYSDKLIDEIKKILISYYSEPLNSANLKYDSEILIIPLKEILEPVTSEDNKTINELINNVKNCKILIDTFSENNRIFVDELINCKANLSKANNNLKNLYNKINFDH